jgi:serine protease AprX
MALIKTRTTILMGALVALVAGPVAAAPAHAHIDRALQTALTSGAPTQHVIITFNPGCRAAWGAALQQHGDVISGEHPFIDALSAEVHTADVDALAQDGCVKAVSADATLYADAAPAGKGNVKNGSVSATSPNLVGPPPQMLTNTLRDTLGLPHASWMDVTVPTAAGVTVAVIDSGIAPNEDFKGRITGFWDFTRGWPKWSQPYDDYGHGTHVAGLIGSSGVLSNDEFQGVAPRVNLIGLKVLDATGQGKTSDVINAIEFVIANRALLNVQVINLSLGHPIYAAAADDPLVQAVEQANAAGLIVVVSAGNYGQKQSDGSVGYMGITSPGNAPSAITVGAVMSHDTTTRTDDQVASYSSRGPTWFDAFAKPDVVAPGHQLASDTSLSSYLYRQLQNDHATTRNGQPLLELSGSSMATAVTSGVVALILQAHNQNGFNHQQALTANLVKGILEYSAITIPGDDYLTEGAGEINAAGAIDLARKIDTSKPVGATWAKNVTPVSVIGGATYFWSQRVIYGASVLGGPVLTANNIVWSTNIVWGTNIVWSSSIDRDADNIVWGTNIVWGANIVWGNLVIGQKIDPYNIVWGSSIVWGTLSSQNIVWGAIVGGADGDGDNIVWGSSVGAGGAQ